MKSPLATTSAIKRRTYTALLLTTALTACAQPFGSPTMKFANHSFAFEVPNDSRHDEILAYRYGAFRGKGGVGKQCGCEPMSARLVWRDTTCCKCSKIMV